MHVKVIGGCGTEIAWARSGCLLVNDYVAFDSGGLASQLSLREQLAVDHVFLTHAHLDHIGELAFLAENTMTGRSRPLNIWAPKQVLVQVRQHLFNNQLWPDFSKIKVGEQPVITYCPHPPDETVNLGTLRIRWARTNHPVYSGGYLVEDDRGALLYSGDTGPTEAIWQLANQSKALRAVFVETAFPNRFERLAHASGHLTPSLLCAELEKLSSADTSINIMHVKQLYYEEIARELTALERPWQIVSRKEMLQLDLQ